MKRKHGWVALSLLGLALLAPAAAQAGTKTSGPANLTPQEAQKQSQKASKSYQKSLRKQQKQTQKAQKKQLKQWKKAHPTNATVV